LESASKVLQNQLSLFRDLLPESASKVSQINCDNFDWFHLNRLRCFFLIRIASFPALHKNRFRWLFRISFDSFDVFSRNWFRHMFRIRFIPFAQCPAFSVRFRRLFRIGFNLVAAFCSARFRQLIKIRFDPFSRFERFNFDRGTSPVGGFMILAVLRSAGFSVSWSAVLSGLVGFYGCPSDSGGSMGAVLTRFPAFGFGFGFGFDDDDDDDDSSDSRSATRPCFATAGFGPSSFSVASFNLPRLQLLLLAMLSRSRLIWRPRPPFHVLRLRFLRIGLPRRFDPFVTLLRLEPTVFVRTLRAQTLRLSGAPFPGLLNNSATLPNNGFWPLLLLRFGLPGILIDPSALCRVRFFGVGLFGSG
jgi:hypothetical protein